jgi:ribosomal protein L37AE/L43A
MSEVLRVYDPRKVPKKVNIVPCCGNCQVPTLRDETTGLHYCPKCQVFITKTN